MKILSGLFFMSTLWISTFMINIIICYKWMTQGLPEKQNILIITAKDSEEMNDKLKEILKNEKTL